MRIIDTIERKGLFRLTRLLAFTSILFLCAMIFYAVKFYFAIENTTYVSIKNLNESLSPFVDMNGDVSIPPDIDKCLGYDKKNRKIFNNWISLLSLEQKNEFISNLIELIKDVESKGGSFTIEQLNSYHEIKSQKLLAAQWDKYAERAQKGAIILFISMLVGMVGLFSLILVLLAIERNTRPVQP